MARKALKKAHAKKRRPIPARPRFAGGEYGHVIPNIPYGVVLFDWALPHGAPVKYMKNSGENTTLDA